MEKQEEEWKGSTQQWWRTQVVPFGKTEDQGPVSEGRGLEAPDAEVPSAGLAQGQEQSSLPWQGCPIQAHRPHAAQDGYECGPTQNHEFT